MDYRRLFKLCDEKGETVAIVRLKGVNGGVYANFSVIEKSLNTANFYFFDGRRYFKILSDGEFFAGADLSLGGAVAVVKDGKVLGFSNAGTVELKKEGFLEFEKSFCIVEEEKSTFENREYDDFKIAEENYFEKERINGTETFCNEKTESKSDEELKNGEDETKILCDETNGGDGEKSGYKPENATFGFFEGGFLFQKSSEKERIYYAFKRIVAGKERFFGLENILPDSEFYVMGENAAYYFGAIRDGGYPRFFAYAVTAKKNAPPKGFENGYFIPKSFFDDEEGFYCLFKDAK